MAATTGDRVAQVVLAFLAMAAFSAFRRGELGDWTRAKFFNWGAPAPDGTVTFAQLVRQAGGNPDLPPGIAPSFVPDGATGADLVQVGSTRMSQRFAARWRPLAAAAAADGIVLTGGAYRSPERQIELRKRNCPDWRNSPASACSPPTAKPGTSRHETGDAIDVNLTGGGYNRNAPEYRWLVANAARFGVYNLPSEPWHWSIDGK